MQDIMIDPIKKSPELGISQHNKILFLVSAIVYFIPVLIFAVDFFLTFPRLDEFLVKNKAFLWWLLAAVQSAYTYIVNKKAASLLRRIEERRQAAARDVHAWDAAEQPAANPAAMDLPATITLRVRPESALKTRARIWIWGLAYAAIFSALCAWSSDFPLLIWHNRFFVWISQHGFYDFLIALAFFVLLGVLMFWGFRSGANGIKITVTQQGLQVGKNMVRWEEARLFAMYNGLNTRVTTYELSSARAIVRWTAFSHPEGPQRDESYMAAIDDYRRQVRALSELIVARTGLPLSDLR